MLFSRMRLVLDREPHVGTVNMAVDEVLLETVREPLLRVYRWKRPAASFGYFTRLDEVPSEYKGLELVRRWTGGGLVPHGRDFTYTLIVPREEPLGRMPASESYREIHACVASALAEIQTTAALQSPAQQGAGRPAGACFQNPVAHDVMSGDEKIAGGAQRRTSTGLLHQGSIQIPDLSADFGETLARHFSRLIIPEPLPAEVLQEADALAVRKYGTPEWLRRF